MGLINIYNPLSTFLEPAPLINFSNMEINFQEPRESNLGLLVVKHECYLCAKPPPPLLVGLHLMLPNLKFDHVFFQTKVITSSGGQNSVTAMLGSLYDAVERQYGLFATRLYRAFRPNPISVRSPSFYCSLFRSSLDQFTRLSLND